MGSDEASGAHDEDGEAGDKEGWSQKEKREGKRSTEREREINKITNASAIVTVHICTVTVAMVYK